MNSTECDSLAADVKWVDPSSLLLLTVLLLITLMVIIGNCLVVAAVYISSKLRTVTNLFIVSLAVADLLVGVAVLPFSSVWEVYKVWIFGDIWCSIWLAVDVWMCTASILNLCAISLDRYVAVTRPVSYPSIMSSSRAKFLIGCVWVLSFVICFPPLAGWKESSIGNDTHQQLEATTIPSVATVRIHGTHTVITGFPPTRDIDEGSDTAHNTDLISYHTNFSEHLINPFVDAASLNYEDDSKITSEEMYMYNNDVVDFADDSERLFKKRVLRSVSSISGVPVLSADLFDMLSASTESPSVSTSPSSPTGPQHCPWTCELTNDRGYVIYSALGSFFIPMAVMLFFYYRIYRAAMLTTRAINQGFRTTKGTGGFGNRFDEQRLTLRIHRGRGSVQNHGSAGSSNTNLTTNGGHSSLSASPSTTSTGKSPELRRVGSKNSRHEPIKISVSYPSNDQISSLPASNNGMSSPRPADKTYLTPTLRRSSFSSSKKTTFSVSPPRRSFMDLSPKRFSQQKGENLYAVHYSNKNGREVTESTLSRSRDPNCYLRVTGTRFSVGGRNSKGQRSLSIDSTNSAGDDESMSSRRNSTKSQVTEECITLKDLPSSPTFDNDSHSQKQRAVPKMGKRNIKAQVKRFRMETKAAKTLAIIVGGFILCWMPFFTLYLVRAFCTNCINPVVFSVLFWLGYCNSAINPCIYALFSKDFRFAFKKIICRCLCGKEQPVSRVIKRRGSDCSTVKTPVHGRRQSCSYNPPNSVGDDSDQGGSDSR